MRRFWTWITGLWSKWRRKTSKPVETLTAALPPTKAGKKRTKRRGGPKAIWGRESIFGHWLSRHDLRCLEITMGIRRRETRLPLPRPNLSTCLRSNQGRKKPS